MQQNEDLHLITGTWLPVMEEFYSLQGEGYNTGEAAYFVRLGGCDNGCLWCDAKESWNALAHPLVGVDDVVERATKFRARSVVVTGGEPLLYNLNYLCKKLSEQGFKIYLETSGSEPISGSWDWVCLSPKKEHPPLPPIYHLANELKVVITSPDDLEFAEKNAREVSKNCHLFLQPEWSARDKIIPVIVDFILQNPAWSISLQSHKYIRIP